MIDSLREQLGRGVEILKADPSGIIALNKPSGVLSMPNKPSDLPKSLLTASYDDKKQAYKLRAASGIVEFHLCNRLDSATSGIIVGSLEQESADELRKLFKQRKVTKVYHAIISGKPSRKSESWADKLQTERKNGRLRTVRSQSGQASITEINVLETFKRHREFSLLEMRPKTGRTHQLRIQAALRNFPILGDKTYGDFSFNRDMQKRFGAKRLFLHASSIEFRQSDQPEPFRCDCEVPAEFTEWVDLATQSPSA